MGKKDNLNSNLSDKIAFLNKTIIGSIPYAGPMLSEIICAAIPNQRLDRVIAYLKSIDENVESLSNEIYQNESKIRLIETGLRASSNSIFQEKCLWIGNIVNNGLTEEIDTDIADEIIQIVEDLNFEQILILYFYCAFKHKSFSDKETFQLRFPETFKVSNFYLTDKEKHEILLNKKRLNISKLAKSGLIIKEVNISTSLAYGSNSSSSRELEIINNELEKIREAFNELNSTDNYIPTELGNLLIKTMMISENSFV